MPKPQKTQGSMNPMLATYQGPKPGDFPLGSPESRAAARALLQESQKLSPYDMDCLLISHSEMWLTASACPNYHDVESTPFYKRGRELEDMRHGPTIPMHLDTEFHKETAASREFEHMYHKKPVVGDVLRYADVEKALPASRYELLVQAYEAAWKRRLPELTFPFRFEGGKLYIRRKLDGRTITWEEDNHIQPHARWLGIAKDAMGLRSYDPAPPDLSSVTAVVFVESPDGKHAVKPLGPNTP